MNQCIVVDFINIRKEFQVIMKDFQFNWSISPIFAI
jgi:hypothetical protein